MKKIASFEQAIGGDGAVLAGGIGVEGQSLKAQVEVTYPIEKIIEPALKVIDDLVDKLEKLIPGDQTGMAQQAKLDARAAIVKALSASA